MSEYYEKLLLGDAKIVAKKERRNWSGKECITCTVAVKVTKQKSIEIDLVIDVKVIELIDSLEIIRVTMPAQMDRLIDAIRGYTSVMVDEANEYYAIQEAGASY